MRAQESGRQGLVELVGEHGFAAVHLNDAEGKDEKLPLCQGKKRQPLGSNFE